MVVDNNGGGTGDTGYNFDASTGTITIDITKIYQSLQTVGSGIVLSGSNTFASLRAYSYKSEQFFRKSSIKKLHSCRIFC